MKIGYFTDTYFPQINGVTYTLSLWKRELEKLGHEVFIYYPDNKAYKPEKNEVPLRSLPFLFYKGYEIGIPSFKRIEPDLDIIHIQTPATVGLLGLAVARKNNVPCIVTHHTPPEKYIEDVSLSKNQLFFEAFKVAYYKYEQEMLERCNLVTSPSDIVIKLLEERHGKKIRKTMFFSNGVDLDFFSEVDTKKFKKDFSVPDGRVVGFAGRHTTEKHLEDLISFADGFDGTVLVGGEGPLTKEYKKMAKGKDNIIFIGFLPRERLCEFYSCIDILGFPSTAETEGLVVLEANACGTPAVGAYAMALKKTIKDGVNGYHYTPGDVRELTEKIDAAYKNLKNLKAGARRFAEDKSVEKTVKKLVSIYNELEGQGVYKK